MKTAPALLAVVLAVMLCVDTRAGGDGDLEAHRPHFFGRLRPVGGCNPDGRGLFHWWNPHCFPQPCGPDDYCRKPMPNVCRPRAPSHDRAYPQTLPTAPIPTPSP